MIRLTCQQGATLAFWPRQQKLEESSAALRLVRFPHTINSTMDSLDFQVSLNRLSCTVQCVQSGGLGWCIEFWCTGAGQCGAL